MFLILTDVSNAAEKKTITIHEISCIATETITGPDEVYFLANDDKHSLSFNSLQTFKATKELNAKKTWKLNQKLHVASDSVVVLVVFDQDTGLEDVKPLLESLADAASVAVDMVANKAKAAAAAKGIAKALSELKDKDDELLFLTITSDERGDSLTVDEKRGSALIGSNSEYRIVYSVK